jgi:hypothetical protein
VDVEPAPDRTNGGKGEVEDAKGGHTGGAEGETEPSEDLSETNAVFV